MRAASPAAASRAAARAGLVDVHAITVYISENGRDTVMNLPAVAPAYERRGAHCGVSVLREAGPTARLFFSELPDNPFSLCRLTA